MTATNVFQWTFHIRSDSVKYDFNQRLEIDFRNDYTQQGDSRHDD